MSDLMTCEDWKEIGLGERVIFDRNAVIYGVPGGWIFADMHGSCFIPHPSWWE